MSAPQILAEIRTDNEISEFIQLAFANSGIPFQIESSQPLRLRLPSTIAALSVLIAVVEEKRTMIQGQVVMPDGLVYEITEKGITELKSVLATALAKPKTSQETPSQPTSNWIVDLLREALRDPDATSKLVRELSSAIKGSPETLVTEIRQVTRVTIAILIILGAVVTATALLAGFGRISGDATGFIFGTILGSAFTFLQRYLVRSEEE